MAASQDSTTPAQSRAAIEGWSRRSRRVALARKALPLVIGAIVLAMAGWIVARAVLPPRITGEVGAILMKGPRWRGQDDQDRQFLIGAVDALRDEREDGRIVLRNPFINLGDARLNARSAVYRQKTDQVTLQGGVTFQDERGGTLTADQATVDLKKGTISGQQTGSAPGVNAKGDFGDISASSFEVYDQGNRMVFRGGVKARIKGKEG